jgi:hypothetical protein
VEVNFTVGTEAAVFRWTSMTGRAELSVGDEHVTLQSPWKLSTHYQLRTRRVWRDIVRGHQVEVVKERPRMMGGVRPNCFTILVDGEVAAKGTGK